jgi:hypothetical protein
MADEVGDGMSLSPEPIKCRRRGCGNEFRRKRQAQQYCSPACQNSARKGSKKRRLKPRRVDVLRSQENGPFYPTKSIACKVPPKPDSGAFVRAQILAQQDQPNPIRFVTPDGAKGRVWLASDDDGNKIIGDDRHWRVHVSEAAKLDVASPYPDALNGYLGR